MSALLNGNAFARTLKEPHETQQPHGRKPMAGDTSENRHVFEQQALEQTKFLYSIAMRLTRNPSDADDLVQETFLKAYRFWTSYDEGTNIRAWLYRILKNSYINLYRKESREPETVDYAGLLGPTYLQQVVPDGNNLNDALFKNQLDDDMSNAVAALKEDFRIIIILCDIEGMTYKETARFLGCPLGTVRSRLHRGRKLLYDRLFDYARRRGYVRPELRPVENLLLVAEG